MQIKPQEQKDLNTAAIQACAKKQGKEKKPRFYRVSLVSLDDRMR
jgi:hypothetical protein